MKLLPLFAALPSLAWAQERPNVLLIIADDLGYGDVSAYGSQTISTPNIDRLAHEGVCLTNGHASSATSTPSRYGLLTGIYPWRRKTNILPGDAPLIIGERQFTLARLFQQAGYRTGAVGKWHLGIGQGKVDWNHTIKPGPNEIGFDYSCILPATVDRVPCVYVENGNVVGLDPNDPIEVNYQKNFEGQPTGVTNPELMTKVTPSHGHNNSVINGIPRIGFMRGGRSALWNDEEMANFLSDRVKQFIDQQPADQPFFLYYGLHEPHVPRIPNSRFVGSTTMGPRGDVIVEADWCVGEVIRKLEERGLLENTIVIFTSDNGPVLDDGYRDQAPELVGQHDMNGGYRGGKYSLYEAGTRVPFFIYWKGHLRHVTSDALVAQQDLMASFARMLGQPLPEGLDSEDHLDAFFGKSRKGRQGMVVEAVGRLGYRTKEYALLPAYKGAKVSITGNEMGIVDTLSLFDLRSDRHQERNVIGRHKKLARRMQAALEAERNK
ncbi:MAG: sulfatase-like hydrolase/transferase [Bacteroidaceae bacterium]|nr:sulfatase-like hydrolase/transferase [Bacteroidaceae bacterium]